MSKPEQIRKTVISRNLRSVDTGKLQNEIKSCEFDTDEINSALESYNSNLGHILDNIAPLKSKTITIRPNNQWYDANCRQAKILRRRLERRKNKSGKQEDVIAYPNQCKYVNFLLKEAKSAFSAKANL